ncbi:MAG TPA: hypothetical protein VJR22_08580 [Candidatus Nitrosotalea sp.]|nr:hypothetical protein [Candidatus Nitrosotalea sp.]
MPDESCRSCGGDLVTLSQCGECRKVVQKICKTCDALTRKQFHNHWDRQEPIPNVGNGCILETISEKPSKKRSYPVRSIALSIGIIGFFILGFATNAYLDVVQTPISDAEMTNAEMTNPDTAMHQVRYASTIPGSLQNCLAYGSGESVTVTCPTQYGYVYKAILDMPKDLANTFSDSVFSIRGVSVTENSDGTVLLQYQNNHYMTNFFAS